MLHQGKIWLGRADEPIYLLPRMANRHGLIAGATGTGKTVTLKVLAESFSDAGVPVFLADVKGDLASLAVAGTENPKVQERVSKLGVEGFSYQAYPVRFWDLFGEGGHPVRTTVSEMGPMLLARLLGLNDTQTGILNIVFRIADDKNLLLIDLKDLRAMVQYVGDNAKELTLEYGNITKQSAGAILRCLIGLEDQGGDLFFGEPDLNIRDWMQTDSQGKGYINILHSVKLYQKPALYSTFLLWMLSELFETLPEEGDMDKPKLVFFFDEAHLLFDNAPKVLVDKVEQVVRLIRSKGVGVYFVTQSPSDLPVDILGQLGNRVQHALRAFTPADQKAVKTAAQTFRPNPNFDTAEAITELGTGEALVSCLDEKGSPSIVERTLILPPQTQFGAIDDSIRAKAIAASPLGRKYNKSVDNESAFELLQEIRQEEEKARRKGEERKKKEKEREQKAKAKSRASTSRRKSALSKATSSAMNTIGREVGKSVTKGIGSSLTRGLLGSLKKW